MKPLRRVYKRSPRLRRFIRQRKDAVSYQLARFALWVPRTMSLPRALALADRIGDLIYVALPQTRRLALSHLELAFGDSLSESGRARIARASFRNAARCFVELAHFDHILAHFDANSVVVYQAYRPAIGRYATEYQRFGGEFSFARMSWIKTNFLWMMYRSGWGTKPGQEVTLAIRMRRAGFDQLLREAVHSSFVADLYSDKAAWADAVARSSVRLQWDPDHHPSGAKLERRAIQLGLQGGALDAFGRRELIDVMNLSDFVAEQRTRWSSGGVSVLVTPRERVYRPDDPDIALRLRLDDAPLQSPDAAPPT